MLLIIGCEAAGLFTYRVQPSKDGTTTFLVDIDGDFSIDLQCLSLNGIVGYPSSCVL
jgi:hypothetical protein